MPSHEPGRRVVVPAYAENPLDGVASMSLQPMDFPSPAELSPGDVVVRVRAAAVGWVDLLMSSGQYQHMAPPPYTPGLECAGEVVSLTPEATGVAVGDKVLVDGFRVGPRSLGAYQRWGGFATWVVAPADALFPLPAPLSLDQSAALLGSYETAYHCLVTRGRLCAGETVLILGATGATGCAAVQVAKLLGATVIAAGRSPDKLAKLHTLGVDHIVALRGPDGDPRSLRDAVKSLTDGRGVDVVYDAVGGELSLEALRCVRFGARFLIVGWAATPLVARGRGERGAPNANALPTNLMMMKSLDVLGCPTAISTAMDPSSRAPRLAQVLAWANEGRLSPVVSHVWPLEAFQEALRAKWSGEVTGGGVLIP
jgi:NADPH2:quinone reductase